MHERRDPRRALRTRGDARPKPRRPTPPAPNRASASGRRVRSSARRWRSVHCRGRRAPARRPGHRTTRPCAVKANAGVASVVAGAPREVRKSAPGAGECEAPLTVASPRDAPLPFGAVRRSPCERSRQCEVPSQGQHVDRAAKAAGLALGAGAAPQRPETETARSGRPSRDAPVAILQRPRGESSNTSRTGVERASRPSGRRPEHERRRLEPPNKCPGALRRQ